MRCLILAVMFFTPFGLTGQQPAPAEGSNWQHVQALPPGANIHVKSRHGSTTCKVKSTDAESLICTRGKDISFSRSEIKSISIPRRGRSALIGLAIGGGGGAIAGYAVGGSGCKSGQSFCLDIVDGKTLAPIGAAVLGGIGAAIGAGTNFASSTINNEP
jgi:hypothetical protein